MIRVYPDPSGLVLAQGGQARYPGIPLTLDDLFLAADPVALANKAWVSGRPAAVPVSPGAPISRQEVWAAGVTYLHSRTARMEEAKDAGGGTFYDKVYHAARPELFFKGTPHRVAASGTPVRIRSDSQWNVPEPELTLALNRDGRLFGYTIGNDMSSRDIEGENLLYLPQAKIYARSCALGPAIAVGATEAAVRVWRVSITIRRSGAAVFSGETSLGQIKRSFAELIEHLFRAQEFPHGAVLLTGTGVVPPDSFTLQPGDEIAIAISGLGELRNSVVTV